MEMGLHAWGLSAGAGVRFPDGDSADCAAWHPAASGSDAQAAPDADVAALGDETMLAALRL
jgi:hypothetical protein